MERRPLASEAGSRLERRKQEKPIQQGREERSESACEEAPESPDMSLDALDLRGTYRSVQITAKVTRGLARLPVGPGGWFGIGALGSDTGDTEAGDWRSGGPIPEMDTARREAAAVRRAD